MACCREVELHLAISRGAFVVMNANTGEIVALKRLHPFLITDSTARARLELYESALRALEQHSIISLINGCPSQTEREIAERNR